MSEEPFDVEEEIKKLESSSDTEQPSPEKPAKKKRSVDDDTYQDVEVSYDKPPPEWYE